MTNNIRFGFIFDIYYSEKKKFVYCVISKNGCSSILQSIAHYDYAFPVVDKFIHDADGIHLVRPNVQMVLDNFSKCGTILKKFEHFKKFIVVRDPLERYVSYINHTWNKHGYDCIFDKSLNSREYIDQVINAYPNEVYIDRHAYPQGKYLEFYKSIFGDDIEVVNIKDLSDYYKQLTGDDFIKNNVTSENNKICTVDSLTEEQLNKIKAQIEKYETFKAN